MKIEKGKQATVYLYHATSSKNVESIKEKGLLIGQKKNFEGMLMWDAIYFAFDAEVARDYAENADTYDGEDVCIFKVPLSALIPEKIGYDWNNLCEYHDDINSIAYFDNIKPEDLILLSYEESLEEDPQIITDFKGTDLYEIVMDIFDNEVESNKEMLS